MKILLVQLARLGDIYLSWPTVRALKRAHPTAEIAVLTRARFHEAWVGCHPDLQVISLQTKNILAPLISDNPSVPESFQRASKFVNDLQEIKYDWILNLSFSPLSSYLTHAISAPETKISGYTRFTDGFLSIPDDMSAYFYAQVGPGRPNRFHLAEIFATLAETDLIEADWKSNVVTNHREGIVVHIGASEQNKSVSATKWATIVQQIAKKTGKPVTLVGSDAERPMAEVIMNSVTSEQIIDAVGKTNLTELHVLIANSELVIGCDSAPMHIASLTKTPCLNVSFPSVNFWETGPRAPGSRVLRVDVESDLASDQVAATVEKMLAGQPSELSVIEGIAGTPSFKALMPRAADFQWKFLLAIYQGKPFPASHDAEFKLALSKLADVNSMVQDQLTYLKGGGDLQKIANILEGAEDVIKAIGHLNQELSPLVRWYQTEKIRIKPAEPNVVLDDTCRIHDLLAQAIEVLQLTQSQAQDLDSRSST